MKRWLMVFSMLASPTMASPFLVADPYPTNVAGQAIPTEFVVTLSGIANPVVTPAVPAGANAVTLKLDLGPLNLSGTRTVTAKARNAWGESAASAPLTFTAGPPTAPTALGLSAQ